ncbi:MAG TPA: hypothetical protein VN222_05055, partial [Novosphingobium sp.]|nr:hypothetical protein [Novosphingobium sp.]
MIWARKWQWLTAQLIAVGVLTTPTQASPVTNTPVTPSFTCAVTSTGVEQVICTTPDLAAADRTMATLYALDRVSAFGSGASDELAAQREALKQMRGCAKPPAGDTVAECLRIEYARRNNSLALAALMLSPDVALPVLRRTDPAFAPVLEAVALWATEPAGADWSDPTRAAKRERISALLAPLVADLMGKDYPRTMLTEPGADGVAVKRVGDIFISERHFTAFLNVLGPYLPDGNWPARSATGRRSLPCAAVIRHPALLGATQSAFGSTLDNFVLDTDCAQTLPPTPMLTALDGKLNAAWPPCDGTIRFAAYRVYETALDTARLGLAHRD